MKMKKVTALIIAVIMSFSQLYTAVLASDIGADSHIIAAPSDAGVVIDSANANASALSRQIKLLDDSVLVMSHTSDKRYIIGSVSGAEWGKNGICITDILKSESGFALSYADELFEENNDTESIKGGYIKAVKDDEVLYIPITTTGKSVTFDGSQNVNNNLDGQAVEIGKQGGIGGKTEDDMSYVLSVGETPVASGKYSRYEYSISSLGMTNANDQPFTIETNIFVSGDAQVQLNIRANTFVTIDNDGYFHYGVNSAMDTVSAQKIEKDKWHRIVIFYDVARRRLQLYSDGEQIAMSASVAAPSMDVTNTVRYGLAAGSVNGSLAIDDIKAYVGYYNSDFDRLDISGDGDNIVARENVIAYNDETINNIDSLKDKISECSNAEFVNICNEDYSSADDTIPSDGKCVLKVGDLYYTYNLKRFFAMENIDFAESDGKISVTAGFANYSQSSKDITMIAVLRNEAGAIEKLYSSDTVTVADTPVNVLIDSIESEGLKLQVFFINNWSIRTAYTSDICEVK